MDQPAAKILRHTLPAPYDQHRASSLPKVDPAFQARSRISIIGEIFPPQAFPFAAWKLLCSPHARSASRVARRFNPASRSMRRRGMAAGSSSGGPRKNANRAETAEPPPCFGYHGGMNTLLLVVVLLLLFGGGGFYMGGPMYGGGALSLILLICLVIFLMGGFRPRR